MTKRLKEGGDTPGRNSYLPCFVRIVYGTVSAGGGGGGGGGGRRGGMAEKESVHTNTARGNRCTHHCR